MRPGEGVGCSLGSSCHCNTNLSKNQKSNSCMHVGDMLGFQASIGRPPPVAGEGRQVSKAKRVHVDGHLGGSVG